MKGTLSNALAQFFINRPQIPPTIETDIFVSLKLQKLLEDCWNYEPSQRPSFSEIIPILDDLLVEIAIPDPTGSELWKRRILRAVFLTSLSSHLI